MLKVCLYICSAVFEVKVCEAGIRRPEVFRRDQQFQSCHLKPSDTSSVKYRSLLVKFVKTLPIKYQIKIAELFLLFLLQESNTKFVEQLGKL